MYTYTCVDIYIYIHIHTCIYTYIYTHILKTVSGARPRAGWDERDMHIEIYSIIEIYIYIYREREI